MTKTKFSKKIKWIIGATASVLVMTPVVATSLVACSTNSKKENGSGENTNNNNNNNNQKYSNAQIANGIQNYFLIGAGANFLSANSVSAQAQKQFFLSTNIQGDLATIQKSLTAYVQNILKSQGTPNISIGSASYNKYDINNIGIQNLTSANIDVNKGEIINVSLTYSNQAAGVNGLTFSGFKVRSGIASDKLVSTVQDLTNQWVTNSVTINNPSNSIDVGFKPAKDSSKSFTVSSSLALQNPNIQSMFTKLNSTDIQNDLSLLAQNYINTTANLWKLSATNAFYNVKVTPATDGTFSGNVYIQILNNSSASQPVIQVSKGSQFVLNNPDTVLYTGQTISSSNSLYINFSFTGGSINPEIISKNQDSFLSYQISGVNVQVQQYNSSNNTSSSLLGSDTLSKVFNLNEASNSLHQPLTGVSFSNNSKESVDNLYKDAQTSLTPTVISKAILENFKKTFILSQLIGVNAATVLQQIVGTSLTTQQATAVTTGTATSSPTLLQILENKTIGNALANILNSLGLKDIASFMITLFSNPTAQQLLDSPLLANLSPTITGVIKSLLAGAISSQDSIWKYLSTAENFSKLLTAIQGLLPLIGGLNGVSASLANEIKSLFDLLFGVKGIIQQIIESSSITDKENATLFSLPIFATLTSTDFFSKISPAFNKGGTIYNILSFSPLAQKILAEVVPLLGKVTGGQNFQLNLQNLIIGILNPTVNSKVISLSNYLATNVQVNGVSLINENGTVNPSANLVAVGTPTVSSSGLINMSQQFNILTNQTATFNISGLANILSATKGVGTASDASVTVQDLIDQLVKNGLKIPTSIIEKLKDITSTPLGNLIPDTLSIDKDTGATFTFGANNQIPLLKIITNNGVQEYQSYLPVQDSVTMKFGASINSLIAAITKKVGGSSSSGAGGVITSTIAPIINFLGGSATVTDGTTAQTNGLTVAYNTIIPITGSNTGNVVTSVPNGISYANNVISSTSIISPAMTTSANITSIFNSLNSATNNWSLTPEQLNGLLTNLGTNELAPTVSITKNEYPDFNAYFSATGSSGQLVQNEYLVNLYFKVPVLVQIGTNVVLTQAIQFSLINNTPLSTTQISINNLGSQF